MRARCAAHSADGTRGCLFGRIVARSCTSSTTPATGSTNPALGSAKRAAGPTALTADWQAAACPTRQAAARQRPDSSSIAAVRRTAPASSILLTACCSSRQAGSPPSVRPRSSSLCSRPRCPSSPIATDCCCPASSTRTSTTRRPTSSARPATACSSGWSAARIRPSAPSPMQRARAVANFFLDELLRNGTTSACVFGTVHRASVEAFFEAAAARRLRMIAGKALMDRGPDGLRDTPESGDRDTRELIERWAGCGRLEYAITPRFAPGSSPEQLRRAGALARDFPRMLIQSHLAESREEVALARRLFPEARSYLDVYDRFGLVRARAIYAHCIHLDEADRRRMAQAGAAAAFCPSSNLFLGSGLFDIEAADAADLKFSVATDVGAGTSFSLLRTLGDAYKVARLSGRRRTAQRARSASTRTSAISIPARRRTSSSSTSLRRRSSPGACAPHAASPTSSPCS